VACQTLPSNRSARERPGRDTPASYGARPGGGCVPPQSNSVWPPGNDRRASAHS
jgi:hypothetical protein